MQTGGEQSLDHVLVQLTSNSVAVVEHLGTGFVFGKQGSGLEFLGDIPDRGNGCADRSAERTEGDVDRYFAARAVHRGEEHVAQRPCSRTFGVPLPERAIHSVQPLGYGFSIC